MIRTRISAVWILAFVVLLLAFLIPSVNAATSETLAEDVNPAAIDPIVPEPPDSIPDPLAEDPVPENPIPEGPVKQGLVEENGAIYFYNDDGTMFTDGYKEVVVDGFTHYYFFQKTALPLPAAIKLWKKTANVSTTTSRKMVPPTPAAI